MVLVTWALVIPLTCMPSALGPAALGLRAYISGKSLAPMLQLLHMTVDNTLSLICKLCYIINVEFCFDQGRRWEPAVHTQYECPFCLILLLA